MALVDAKQTALSMTETLSADLGDVIFIQELRSSASEDKADTRNPEICIRKKMNWCFDWGRALNRPEIDNDTHRAFIRFLMVTFIAWQTAYSVIKGGHPSAGDGQAWIALSGHH